MDRTQLFCALHFCLLPVLLSILLLPKEMLREMIVKDFLFRTIEFRALLPVLCASFRLHSVVQELTENYAGLGLGHRRSLGAVSMKMRSLVRVAPAGRTRASAAN